MGGQDPDVLHSTGLPAVSNFHELLTPTMRWWLSWKLGQSISCHRRFAVDERVCGLGSHRRGTAFGGPGELAAVDVLCSTEESLSQPVPACGGPSGRAGERPWQARHFKTHGRTLTASCVFSQSRISTIATRLFTA